MHAINKYCFYDNSIFLHTFTEYLAPDFDYIYLHRGIVSFQSDDVLCIIWEPESLP